MTYRMPHTLFHAALAILILLTSCKTAASGAGSANSASAGASPASSATSQAQAGAAKTAAAKTADAKPKSQRKPFEKPETTPTLPASSGTNRFAGNTYETKDLRVEFTDGGHLTLWIYGIPNANDKGAGKKECWQKELEASYSFSTAKSKLYIRTDCVYAGKEKCHSAKELFRNLWPEERSRCKKYLNTTEFSSESKKNFLDYAMLNLESASRARFESLATFSYKFSDGEKTLTLTESLDANLSRVLSKEQIIGADGQKKVQFAFSNFSVQILAMDKNADDLPSLFCIGSCDFDEEAKKVRAQMFRIEQRKRGGKTVQSAMQYAGSFNASYSVQTEVNAAAQEQHFCVYNGVYKFAVESMPEGMPGVTQMEIPAYLHADIYILKKATNPASAQ